MTDTKLQLCQILGYDCSLVWALMTSHTVSCYELQFGILSSLCRLSASTAVAFGTQEAEQSGSVESSELQAAANSVVKEQGVDLAAMLVHHMLQAMHMGGAPGNLFNHPFTALPCSALPGFNQKSGLQCKSAT